MQKLVRSTQAMFPASTVQFSKKDSGRMWKKEAHPKWYWQKNYQITRKLSLSKHGSVTNFVYKAKVSPPETTSNATDSEPDSQWLSSALRNTQGCQHTSTHIEKLGQLWKQELYLMYLRLVWVDMPDPMLEQHTSQILFEKFVAGQVLQWDSIKKCINIKQLMTDKENILRYVAGYVPFKLMNRFEEYSHHDELLECLSHMSVGSGWNKSIEVDCSILVTLFYHIKFGNCCHTHCQQADQGCPCCDVSPWWRCSVLLVNFLSWHRGRQWPKQTPEVHDRFMNHH